MKYKVLCPLSHRVNGVLRDEPVGKIISDKEMDKSILEYHISKNRLKQIGGAKKKVKKIKKEIVAQKKISRVSKEETKISGEDAVEQEQPLMGAYELSREGLRNKSKSELKRIASQLGLAISGTKDMLVNRLINSGL